MYRNNGLMTQRVTQAQKDANDKAWYKEQARILHKHSGLDEYNFGFGGVSDYTRMKTNYDLFNGIVNTKDFEYVCKPFGANGGELPASFAHRDIISNKIKVLLGMEMTMPFSWTVFAVNEDATTRIEQETFGKIREFVTNYVMEPIRMQQAIEEQQALAGRELTPQEIQDIQEEIRQKYKAMTPDAVRKYMAREHQDPAQVLGNQLLQYLIWAKDVRRKFETGWKHSTITGKELYWVGERNGEPDLMVANPLFFRKSKAKDEEFVENGEWAIYEMRLTPNQIVKMFGEELSNSDIDRIYDRFRNGAGMSIENPTFNFDNYETEEDYTLSVFHYNWISLRKIGFLTSENVEKPIIVDESYELDEESGDISIEWEWIPQAHECYQILDDIFVYCRPVPGQMVDLENLYSAHLSYYGAEHDSLNSPTTSPMDRGKAYQYFYDVLIYRIELLIASDKGKKVFMNLNHIPKSAGIDIQKWMYFFDANNIGFLSPNEEGNRGAADNNIVNAAKQVDMSMAADIDKYIKLAEYIDVKCGEAMGVTKQMEGGIGPTEAVTNTKQNLMQSSYIIRPYFQLHTHVKARVLAGLLEQAKVCYTKKPSKKLSYILDDMSMALLTIDAELLENSSYGMFVANAGKAADVKMAVEQLAHAALQNQTLDFSDVIKVLQAEDTGQALELLEAGQEKKLEATQSMEMQKMKQLEKIERMKANENAVAHGREKELIVLKESERRKTEIQKQTILSLGFNEDKDLDDDGTPDVLEVAKFGVDASIREKELALRERQQDHKEEYDKEKLAIEKKKAVQKKVIST